MAALGGDAPASGGRDVLRGAVPVLAAGAAVVAAVTDPAGPLAVAALAGAAALFAVWAVWPRTPTAALATGVLVLVVAAKSSGDLDGALFLVTMLVIAVAGWERSTPLVLGAGLAALGTPVLLAALRPGDIDAAVWVFAIAFPGVMAWLFRRQEELTAQLEATRRELTVAAVEQERRRIARDVHDVVGHGLAAVLLQVSGARHVLRRDVDEADAALAAAEAAGRHSLGELRTTVAALRDPVQGDGARTPLPGLAGIDRLVEDSRAAGLAVAHDGAGEHDGVDPAVGVALYRIAQEALVNAARYAPQARTVVATEVRDGRVELRVHSTGPVDGTGPRRPGYGLIGMRERARVVGGELEAGPTDDGWLVRATVPAVVS